MSHSWCDIIIMSKSKITRHRKGGVFFIAKGKGLYAYDLLSEMRKKSR